MDKTKKVESEDSLSLESVIMDGSQISDDENNQHKLKILNKQNNSVNNSMSTSNCCCPLFYDWIEFIIRICDCEYLDIDT